MSKNNSNPLKNVATANFPLLPQISPYKKIPTNYEFCANFRFDRNCQTTDESTFPLSKRIVIFIDAWLIMYLLILVCLFRIFRWWGDECVAVKYDRWFWCPRDFVAARFLRKVQLSCHWMSRVARLWTSATYLLCGSLTSGGQAGRLRPTSTLRDEIALHLAFNIQSLPFSCIYPDPN